MSLLVETANQDIAFSVTEVADSKISFILQSENQKIFRIEIQAGGCNGYQQRFSTGGDILKDDFILELKENQYKIAIDPISMGFLKGATLKYVSKVGEEYFFLEMPKAGTRCGCNSSFSMTE